MKKFSTFACLLLLCIGVQANAQKTKQDTYEQQTVFAVIQQLFEGMKNSDSTKVRTTFHKKARLLTTFTNKEGKPVMMDESIDDFVKSVGTPHEKAYDERLGTHQILIDDNLATVWTEYKFYVSDTFSHCGINAFQLFKSEQGWKIIHVTDTRRKTPCK
jgi:hypothetical protein